jgi:DNA-binding transcriptional LysR family regulator
VDLKQLQIFDTLLAEGSVSRSAQQLNLTQSAVSHSLARLRETFADPLFVATPKGMVPTPRALELAKPLRLALAQLVEATASRKAFVPLCSETTFRISTSDYVGYVLLPALLKRLAAEAPQVQIVVTALDTEPCMAALADGRLDLLIGTLGSASARYRTAKLYSEEFLCVVREGHPSIKSRLSLKQFLSLGHVLISPRGGGTVGSVDRVLAKRGLQRRIVLSIPQYLVAPEIIRNSDYVITLAARVACQFAGALSLRTFRPPIPVNGFVISQRWHERRLNDAAHKWFRELVAEVAKSV